MCGIAGIVLTDRNRLAEARVWVKAMTDRLAHRGPDDDGLYVDEAAGVVLGHRRLSIIDLSDAARQPMVRVREGATTAVVHNGEIYNFPALRQELLGAGAPIVSKSDTEVVLWGYREFGSALPERLVGMFAFAVWDAQARCLFLARDRAGEKPLYYARLSCGLAFASEFGALAELPGLDTRLDVDAVARYLHLQYVPDPDTVFRGARKLPPAHAMTILGAGTPALTLKTWRYWDAAAFMQAPRLKISDADAEARLLELLREAVRGQMLSDVPLGAFLSGGIDSSLVVALMREASGTPVRTFTIGFDVPEFDESPYADAVASQLGTEHTADRLSERDALSIVPRLPAMYGEPFADSSAMPTHLVSVVARRQVTVSLSGDGGDELFGGYRRYWWLRRVALAARVSAPFGPLARAVLRAMPGRLGRAATIVGQSPEDSFARMVGVFTPAEVAALMGRTPEVPEFRRAWDRAASAGRPLYQRAMLADFCTYLPGAILTKVDRAAMATSLETRAPLLDHRVAEFALTLPARLVERKVLLKRLAARFVPWALLDRPKQGFGVPLVRWFRHELRELLEDLLTPARLEAVGVHNWAFARTFVDEHLSGRRNHTPRLWTLLMLVLWHEAQAAGASRF